MSMHILLVEPNPDHVFLARKAIEEIWNGVTLHIAPSLGMVRGGPHRTDTPAHFDVLLATLDPRDPGDLACLDEIRRSAPFDKATLIALVNSTRDQELAQAANPPFDWVLLKPLRAESLRELLQVKPLP